MGEQAASATLGIVDAGGVRSWLASAMSALGEARSAIDSLNVFPIADGDTGTNMFLTLESCWQAVAGHARNADDAQIAETVEEVRTAAIMGARGNSGVITAEALRGICDVLAEVPGVTSIHDLARALRAASDRARSAVAHPVEGTILTVAAAAARAAEELAAEQQTGDGDADTLRETLLLISQSMHQALADTTHQLAVLAQAGVVDAGAQGLVLVYDALLDEMSGVRRRFAPVEGRVSELVEDVAPAPDQTGEYEVMFLCEAKSDTVDEVRRMLDVRGDSLVVSGGPQLWNVHVHVDDPGGAIEAIQDLVRAHNIRITHLPSQRRAQREAADDARLRAGRGIVAQVHGPGVRALVEDSGAMIISGRPQHRPSTAEILDAIAADGHEEVVLLPSDADTIPVAEVAADQARERGVRVTVIPTRSIVQTLAAIAVHDPQTRFDDAVVAMADAARATRYAAITVATKEALTSAGRCQVGDVLGLVEGDIVEIGMNPGDVAACVLARLMSTGGELVTAVVGSDADPRIVDHLRSTIARDYPGVDLEVIEGGQPLWPLIVGVE